MFSRDRFDRQFSNVKDNPNFYNFINTSVTTETNYFRSRILDKKGKTIALHPEHTGSTACGAWKKKELNVVEAGRRDSRRHLSLLPAPFVKYTIQANYRETFDLKVRTARLTPSASVNTRHNRYVVPRPFSLPFFHSFSLSLSPSSVSLHLWKVSPLYSRGKQQSCPWKVNRPCGGLKNYA